MSDGLQLILLNVISASMSSGPAIWLLPKTCPRCMRPFLGRSEEEKSRVMNANYIVGAILIVLGIAVLSQTGLLTSSQMVYILS